MNIVVNEICCKFVIANFKWKAARGAKLNCNPKELSSAICLNYLYPCQLEL